MSVPLEPLYFILSPFSVQCTNLYAVQIAVQASSLSLFHPFERRDGLLIDSPNNFRTWMFWIRLPIIGHLDLNQA